MGLFITIEGSEGSGKTTALKFIQKVMKDHNLDYVMTREPGGTNLAEKLRDLLLHFKNREIIDPIAELLIIFAARKQHLQNVILPSLEKNKIVICDRFTDSTWAYQGGGRQLDNNFIKQLEEKTQNGLKPDLTILLDIPVEQGLERAKNRSCPDRFESEKLAFFERVRSVYLARAKKYPNQFYVIDSSRTPKFVNNEIELALKGIIKEEAFNVRVS